MTGSTHDERVRERAEQAKQEAARYELYKKRRAALAEAQRNGTYQSMYAAPVSPYAYNGLGGGYGGRYSGGYDVYGSPYGYGSQRYGYPNARYQRGYGGYGGGGMGMGMGGGLLGGLLVGSLLF